MSASFIDGVRRAIAADRRLRRGDKVLLAVSGGADSVAMLLAFCELAPALGIRPIVAHLDHGIRGREARGDARFVRQLARRGGLPLAEDRVDVPALARRDKLSLEMAARQARYAFLTREARRHGARLMVTAHTADDQAETVLLKLLRGAGLKGLAGIPRQSSSGGVALLRPLLDTTRRDLETFLRRRRQAWREDSSNRDDGPLRNRIRHELLPLLESRFNPSIRRVLTRMAEVIRADDAWLEEGAARLLPACLEPGGFLRASRARGFCEAARRRVLRAWLVDAGVPPEAVDFDAVERVDRLVMGPVKTRWTDLPGGGRVECRGDRLRVVHGAGDGPAEAFRKRVRIPGVTLLEKGGLRITTELKPGLVKDRSHRIGKWPAVASLGAESLRGQILEARSWRPGDRIRPLGMSGSRKLQDVFVDAKVPADRRNAIPVFACGRDIVWVPGYRVARGWEVRKAAGVHLQVRVDRAGTME